MTAKNNTRKPFGHWNNKDNCAAESKKYPSRNKFRAGSNAAFLSCQRNHWIDELQPLQEGAYSQVKWNYDQCMRVAILCSTNVEFRAENISAYNAVIRYGWKKKIEDDTSIRFCRTKKKVELIDVYIAVFFCSTRGEVQRKYNAVYGFMSGNGLIERLMPIQYPVKKWTFLRLLSASLRYRDRVSFKECCPSAYSNSNKVWMNIFYGADVTFNDKLRLECIDAIERSPSFSYLEKNHSRVRSALRTNDWPDVKALFDALPRARKRNGYWTFERCRDEALKCIYVSEFANEHQSAWWQAHQSGWINKITKHLTRRNGDNDAIYILRSDQFYCGIRLYKLGMTSWRLNGARWDQLRKASGFHLDPIYHSAVGCKATDVEGALKLIGTDPLMSGFDGATEYRAWRRDDLAQAMQVVESHSISVREWELLQRKADAPVQLVLGW